MPDPKDEPNRGPTPEPEAPEADDRERDRGYDEALKNVTRLPRKGDELDDLRGTPTD